MARIIQTKDGHLTRQFFLQSDHVSIGRSKTNLIQLNEKIISSQHAEIFTEHDHLGNEIYFLMDLNSTNGSYINKYKISCKQLKHKDRIRFGHQMFTFINENENEKPESH
jgi:pSer/pThr/pTyr-binding forkhead associated (FHA) protein